MASPFAFIQLPMAPSYKPSPPTNGSEPITKRRNANRAPMRTNQNKDWAGEARGAPAAIATTPPPRRTARMRRTAAIPPISSALPSAKTPRSNSSNRPLISFRTNCLKSMSGTFCLGEILPSPFDAQRAKHSFNTSQFPVGCFLQEQSCFNHPPCLSSISMPLIVSSIKCVMSTIKPQLPSTQ